MLSWTGKIRLLAEARFIRFSNGLLRIKFSGFRVQPLKKNRRGCLPGTAGKFILPAVPKGYRRGVRILK